MGAPRPYPPFGGRQCLASIYPGVLRDKKGERNGLTGILSFRDEKRMKNRYARAYNPLIYTVFQTSKM